MAGKNRDLQRKKDKYRKNSSERLDKRKRRTHMDVADVLPDDLAVMAAQALKRFMVTVYMQKIDKWTIYAHDVEEAKQFILKGDGRPAGGSEPRIAKMDVEEMGVGDPKNMELLENIETERNPKVKPIIEVVTR